MGDQISIAASAGNLVNGLRVAGLSRLSRSGQRQAVAHRPNTARLSPLTGSTSSMAAPSHSASQPHVQPEADGCASSALVLSLRL
jgi:hypothetical protein